MTSQAENIRRVLIAYIIEQMIDLNALGANYVDLFKNIICYRQNIIIHVTDRDPKS